LNNNLIRDERGIALPVLIVFLPILLFAMVFAVDLTNMLSFRHELQTIADSVSLAGASASTVDPKMGLGYKVDEYGNITGNSSAIVDYEPVIDPLDAQREARSAFTKNSILIEKLRKNGKLITDWEGRVEGGTKYAVTVTGKMKTTMWGKVQRIIDKSDGDFILVRVKSTAGIQEVP